MEAVLPDPWSCAGFHSRLQEAEVVVFEFVTTEGLKPKHKVYKWWGVYLILPWRRKLFYFFFVIFNSCYKTPKSYCMLFVQCNAAVSLSVSI